MPWLRRCTFVSISRRVIYKKKKRENQTRLKTMITPHGNSECGKVWCEIESSQ